MDARRAPAVTAAPVRKLDRADLGKRSVLGVLVNVLDYRAATEQVVTAARQRRPLSLTALAVHGVMTGVKDPVHRARLNAFDIVTPDGQPVRWALNLLHGADLPDRVCGPELVPRILRQLAREGLPVYLYGATPDTLSRLSSSLPRQFPGLRISGAEPSRFRTAEPGETRRIADRVTGSGARVLLVGLGCPRQEVFTYAMRPLLDLPVLAVGAVFDYLAGRMRRAPRWMERYGLAWSWRLLLEPRRLWRRYLLLNPEYLLRLAAQKARLWRPLPPVATDRYPEAVPV